MYFDQQSQSQAAVVLWPGIAALEVLEKGHLPPPFITKYLFQQVEGLLLLLHSAPA